MRPATPKKAARSKPAPSVEEPPGPVLVGPLRLGVFPGAAPGIWVDRWRKRLPDVPFELVPTEAANQERALRAHEVDAALVRLPVQREGLHVIPLYEETTVVAFGTDSSLGAADELAFDDLAGEILFVPADDVLGPLDIPGVVPARGPQLATTADALETVAAGVGIVILPLSLVRLHRRRDVTHRPLAGAPTSAVALAWVAENTSPEIEALVGIVRGRTARSSRG
ncbi:MAG: LysR family substrate-binding domain-containing protein [Microbacterium sp.]|uniref:LysR family substrate-binding domain-containing protein n=1 Tax=Microbacterium sp. TaxID=51671 RepID=UPI002724B363|nr:LysR family substrate-binding domain-containing protein [Microbacterium sp.]MDO8383255.1 LysR family substrate-binding domain-containing protein [Microbacterium sp.]